MGDSIVTQHAVGMVDNKQVKGKVLPWELKSVLSMLSPLRNEVASER